MINLLVGFLLIILPASFSFLKEHDTFRKNKTNSKLYWLVFLVSISGAIWTTYHGYQSNQEETKRSIETKILNDSLLHINNTLTKIQNLNTELLLEQRDSTRKIISINNKLYEINSNIQSIQKNISNNLIGDGNIPHLYIYQNLSEQNFHVVDFFIGNDGDTPIRGLKVYVEDRYSDFFVKDTSHYIFSVFNNEMDKYSRYEINQLMYKQFFIGDKPPHTLASFYSPKIQNIHSNFSFVIHVNWDNGSYTCIVHGKEQIGKPYPKLELQSSNSSNKEVIKQRYIFILNLAN
jgi:hypothetical protein